MYNKITNGKGKLDNKCQTQVVYKIDCNNCDKTYIRHSKRIIKTRIKEHNDNFNLLNSQILNVKRISRKR